MIFDFCIVGGGIVGLAAALKLLERRPGASIVLLEKEDHLAAHQTGHNSGVIHSGIYYAPGSLKAKLCRIGAQETTRFCDAHNVRYEVCGKLIVATSPSEMQRMDALFERSKVNAIEVHRIDAAELKRREPAITGMGALFVPSTGIVDYPGMCAAMAGVLRESGAEIHLSTAVDRIVETGDRVTVSAGEQRWEARQLVVCGGLQADRLARMAGLKPDFHVVPFRGEYFQLPPSKNAIVSSLIYPVPDPELPFLGIHLTRMIDGSVTVGPNAALGFSREGYPKLSMNLADIADYAAFGGFWKLLKANRKSAFAEFRNSIWKPGYLAECQKYCPELTLDDLRPYRPGIRAQAVSPQGQLIHDFLFAETDRMLHVCNAPSPAATSSLPIGDMIADRVLNHASSDSRLGDAVKAA